VFEVLRELRLGLIAEQDAGNLGKPR
jgi:hypothetical protein